MHLYFSLAAFRRELSRSMHVRGNELCLVKRLQISFEFTCGPRILRSFLVFSFCSTGRLGRGRLAASSLVFAQLVPLPPPPPAHRFACRPRWGSGGGHRASSEDVEKQEGLSTPSPFFETRVWGWGCFISTTLVFSSSKKSGRA